MRDRVGALGGTIDIRSKPGHGTVIAGAIPVERVNQRDAQAAVARPTIS
jgi:signal transduction histidine kinase